MTLFAFQSKGVRTLDFEKGEWQEKAGQAFVKDDQKDMLFSTVPFQVTDNLVVLSFLGPGYAVYNISSQEIVSQRWERPYLKVYNSEFLMLISCNHDRQILHRTLPRTCSSKYLSLVVEGGVSSWPRICPKKRKASRSSALSSTWITTGSRRATTDLSRCWMSTGCQVHIFSYCFSSPVSTVDIAPCHLCNTLRIVLRCNVSVTQ